MIFHMCNQLNQKHAQPEALINFKKWSLCNLPEPAGVILVVCTHIAHSAFLLLYHCDFQSLESHAVLWLLCRTHAG